MFTQANTPDPHPGRCHCVQFNSHPGVMQYERCLGYENEPHICEWEKRVPDPSWGVSIYKPPEPKPWVRPETT